MLNLKSVNKNIDGGLTGVLLKLSGSGYRDYSNAVNLGNWTLTSIQNGDWNNDKYSKSYHRKYGGVFEVSSRSIEFKRKHGKGFIIKSVELKSWAGNFVAKAILEAGLEPKNPKFSLKIRLNKAFDAKKLGTIRGRTVYSRTLLGEHIDYAIEFGGVVFHAENQKELFSGLHNKIRKQCLKLKGELLGFNDCKKLGFCDTGIKEFCDVFGLSLNGKYAPFEIKAIIKNKREQIDGFISEIKDMSKAINYDLLDF